MKTIIAGSRSITNPALLDKAIREAGFLISEVVSGKAKGVDTLGERWARLNNIPIASFPADWDTYGKRAGPIRNKQMADYADALILIWDGVSKGSRDMLFQAKNKNLKVFVYYVNS